MCSIEDERERGERLTDRSLENRRRRTPAQRVERTRLRAAWGTNSESIRQKVARTPEGTTTIEVLAAAAVRGRVSRPTTPIAPPTRATTNPMVEAVASVFALS